MKTKKANLGDIIRAEELGKALFVVEKAEMEGGQEGTRYNNYDAYPDGWYIEARRLNDNRTYNPQGKVVRFYQSGFFNKMIEQVEVVGKMQQCWKEVSTQ